jgi:hypothetical protein
MGTDFTYEDLQPDAIENYRYHLLPPEQVNHSDCHVIEIKPATEEKKKESAYSKRVVWVRKDILFTIKIEFYDRRGRLLKTQSNHDLAPLTGEAWAAEKTLMVNHRTDHKTLMGVKSREINASIDDEVFSERYLLSDRRRN